MDESLDGCAAFCSTGDCVVLEVCVALDAIGEGPPVFKADTAVTLLMRSVKARETFWIQKQHTACSPLLIVPSAAL